MARTYLLTLAFCLSLLSGANAIAKPDARLATVAENAATEIIRYRFEVVAERSHKKILFTQGLLLDAEHFYESSGLYGRSMLVRYPVAEPDNKWAQLSAKFTQQTALPPQYFAEGLTLFNNKLYLLTWREEKLLIFNRATLALEETLPYSGEGWGLTNDDTHLIRSDGSHQLTFHEPKNFRPVRILNVLENGEPLARLNELEYIDGKIWANVWYENRLVEIDPVSGAVVGSIDLTTIANQHTADAEQVLNGVAYDAQRQALWITGKLWPKMFLIRLIKPD